MNNQNLLINSSFQNYFTEYSDFTLIWTNLDEPRDITVGLAKRDDWPIFFLLFFYKSMLIRAKNYFSIGGINFDTESMFSFGRNFWSKSAIFYLPKKKKVSSINQASR